MAYSEEEKTKIFDKICDSIVCGMSLRSALSELKDDNVIFASDFFRWIREDEEKRKQYARATEERSECMFEDILDIADNGTNDWMEKKNKEGEILGYVLNGEAIQRSKLRYDARIWHLSKVKPKKYGNAPEIKDDELDNEITIKVIDGTK